MKRVLKSMLSVTICFLILLGSILGLKYVFIILNSDVSATYMASKCGDIIEFGSYPQTLVIDEEIVNALNMKAELYDWYDYGYTGKYRSETNLETEISVDSYMKYMDIDIDSDDMPDYRGVNFTYYRGSGDECYPANSEYYHTQNGLRGFFAGTTYWFKYEPLKWRVLDSSNGILMSEYLIDAQPFNNAIYYNDNTCWGDAENTYFASNYSKSYIRNWLTDCFYNVAFSSEEQEIIKTYACDNYTKRGYLIPDSSFSQYDSDPVYTIDKVFLLSYGDVRKTSWGFESTESGIEKREAYGTDYAFCQGLSEHNYSGESNSNRADWWLRTPNNDDDDVCIVWYDELGMGNTPIYIEGIRPAISLKKNNIKLNANGGYFQEKYQGNNVYLLVTEETASVFPCEKVGDLPIPKNPCYLFDGWFTDLDYFSEITSNSYINEDLTLYAKWEMCNHLNNTNPQNCYSNTRCSICDGVIYLAEHDWDTVPSYDSERHWYACKRCNDIKDSERHEWYIAENNWSTDKQFCTITRKCSLNGCNWVETLTSTNVKQYTYAPSCENNGSIVYTAKFNDLTLTQTKKVVIPKLGHKDDNNDGKCDICYKTLNQSKYDEFQISGATINTGKSRTVDYTSDVFITATANDLPSEYRLIIYDGDKPVSEGSNQIVNYNIYWITETKTITVKINDAGGKVVSTKDREKTVTITVNSSWFSRIIAFLRIVFRLGPKTIEIKP